MTNRQPICQMCRGEICALCREKITQCKCPCPNFVICKICSVQEQTLPFSDDPVNPAPAKSNTPMVSKISPSMSPMMAIAMMMMNNMNKGKSCDCDKRSTGGRRVGPRKSKSKECCHQKPSKIEISCPTASKNGCQCGYPAPQTLCRCEEANPACVPPSHPHEQPQQGPKCVCADSRREPICHTHVRQDCDFIELQRRQQYSYAQAQQHPCQQVEDYICQPTQQYPHRYDETFPSYGDPPRYGGPSGNPQFRRTTQGLPDRRKTQDIRYDENPRGRSPNQVLPQEDEQEPFVMNPREDSTSRKSPPSPSKSTAPPPKKPFRKDSAPPRDSPPKPPRKDSSPPRGSPPKPPRNDSSPLRGSPPQLPRKDSVPPRKSPRDSEVSRHNPPKPKSQPPHHGSMVTHKA